LSSARSEGGIGSIASVNGP